MDQVKISSQDHLHGGITDQIAKQSMMAALRQTMAAANIEAADTGEAMASSVMMLLLRVSVTMLQTVDDELSTEALEKLACAMRSQTINSDSFVQDMDETMRKFAQAELRHRAQLSSQGCA